MVRQSNLSAQQKQENRKKKRPTRRSDSDQARGQKEKPARETRTGQKHEEEARQADRKMPGKKKWKTRRDYGWYSFMDSAGTILCAATI